MNFTNFEQDCNDAWIAQLKESYQNINFKLYDKTSKKLHSPIFHINPNINAKWGSWSPSDRVMTFSAKLMRNFEWAAVEYVLKHEMAHQIVSEVFDMDAYGVSHGAFWQRACDMIDCPKNRCASHDFLSEFKGKADSPMVEKIKKLMSHGGSEAATEEEAEAFMKKAQELMIKHDVDIKDFTDEKCFVKRPIGPNLKRWETYLWTLGSLLKEHYDVECIKTYSTVGGKQISRLELFGEPDKLDIAEYVGHAIINQGEILYKQFKKERAKENKKRRDQGLYNYGKVSKAAFMQGLIKGYNQKLRNEREAVEEHVIDKVKAEGYVGDESEIIPVYDERLLKEMYMKEYPNLRHSSYAGTRGQGYGEGHKQGQNLRLSQGVRGGGNNGRLLNA